MSLQTSAKWLIPRKSNSLFTLCAMALPFLPKVVFPYSRTPPALDRRAYPSAGGLVPARCLLSKREAVSMDQAPAQDIFLYLRAQLPEMVALLRQLVLAESPSTEPDAQRPVFAPLAESLGRLNYTVRHIPGRQTGGQLYARPSHYLRHQPRQLLLGHCDTVWPLGTLQNMPLEMGAGVMRGPGAYDMKAGLVQMLYALRALQALHLEPLVTPLVFINSDEEIGSRESTPYVRQLARVVDRALVLEPSLGAEGKLKIARKGVGRFTVVVKGKAAHAGLNPAAGASAILELSYVIQKLFALNNPAEGISVNVGVIDGGLRPNVIA